MKTVIKQGKTADFFARGREVAKRADRGEKLTPRRIVTFEDPADMLKLLTKKRLELFSAVKAHPGSIQDISTRLHRDRSAVKRDVDDFARLGLFLVETTVHPGHGHKKEVRAAADELQLECIVR